MAFVVKKHLALDFVGDGWSGAFLDFRGLTFKEVREFSKVKLDEENPDSDENLDRTLKLLETHFLGGAAWDGEKLQPLKTEDLGDLPVDVLVKGVQLLVGTDENLSTTSKK